MAEDDPEVGKGRRLIHAVAFSLIGSIVLVAVLTRAIGPQLFLQIAVFGLLVFQTLRGRGWARWVLVGLSALAAFGYGAAAAGREGPVWVLLPLAVVYVACAAVIALSPAVRRFLEAQRARS